jgi:hypothetical protein
MQGGCLCGQVRYQIEAKPAITAVCHCKHCQRQAGTAFALVVAVPKQAVKLKGPLKTFRDTGDSGQPVARNFCAECGSPITSEISGTPNLLWVKAGTLDDTSDLQPTMQIFCDSAQPWVRLEGLQSFPRMPAL